MLSQVQGGGHTAWHEGNLEAFVRERGTLGGAYMRKGAEGQITCVDVFSLVEFTMVDYMDGIIYTPQKTPLTPPLGGA